MTADPGPAERDDTDVVLESRRYVLLEGPTGYAIWRVRDEREELIARFDDSDAGLEEAIERWDRIHRHERRGTTLTALAWVVGTLAAIWLVFTAIVMVWAVVLINRREELDPATSFFWRWNAQELLTVLPTAFMVSVGLYVVIWMHFRRLDE